MNRFSACRRTDSLVNLLLVHVLSTWRLDLLRVNVNAGAHGRFRFEAGLKSRFVLLEGSPVNVGHRRVKLSLSAAHLECLRHALRISK